MAAMTLAQLQAEKRRIAKLLTRAIARNDSSSIRLNARRLVWINSRLLLAHQALKQKKLLSSG
jgi:hypothetical protein